VRAQRGEKSISVKARQVVVFVRRFRKQSGNDPQLPSNVPYCYTSGTPYYEGDGITMAMSVDADLWHMNNYAGPLMALNVPEVVDGGLTASDPAKRLLPGTRPIKRNMLLGIEVIGVKRLYMWQQ
jgi:hypothetical protein